MYRNIILLEVLSEEPLQSYDDLERIAYEMDQGSMVGSWTMHKSEQISDSEMKESLYRLGSEPSFFFEEETEA